MKKMFAPIFFLVLLGTPLLIQNQQAMKKLTISEIFSDGRYITLSDDSRWEVAPSDRDISAAWIGAAPVTVSPSKPSEGQQENAYSYTITNEWTKKNVSARPLGQPHPRSRAH